MAAPMARTRSHAEANLLVQVEVVIQELLASLQSTSRINVVDSISSNFIFVRCDRFVSVARLFFHEPVKLCCFGIKSKTTKARKFFVGSHQSSFPLWIFWFDSFQKPLVGISHLVFKSCSQPFASHPTLLFFCHAQRLLSVRNEIFRTYLQY